MKSCQSIKSINLLPLRIARARDLSIPLAVGMALLPPQDIHATGRMRFLVVWVVLPISVQDAAASIAVECVGLLTVGGGVTCEKKELSNQEGELM